VRILLLHGLLHLSGLDHETDNGEMAARETNLRRKLRLPNTLIDRVEKPPSKKTPANRKLATPATPVRTLRPKKSKPRRTA